MGMNVNYNGHKVTDAETRRKLEELANRLQTTVNVTSGDRTPEDQDRLRNAGYQPAQNSQHLHGKAADIYVDGKSTAEVAAMARHLGFTGIGVYRDGHVHVDTRDASGVVTWSK